jgi:hypothetical protein
MPFKRSTRFVPHQSPYLNAVDRRANNQCWYASNGRPDSRDVPGTIKPLTAAPIREMLPESWTIPGPFFCSESWTIPGPLFALNLTLSIHTRASLPCPAPAASHSRFFRFILTLARTRRPRDFWQVNAATRSRRGNEGVVVKARGNKNSPFPVQVSVNRVVELAPIGTRTYDRVMHRGTDAKVGKRHGIVLEQGEVVNLISAMGGF